MASDTQIGKLVIDLQIKTQALEKGLETAKKKLQEIEQQNEELKNSNSQLDVSFIAMTTGIIASLHKVTGVIKDSVEEYKQYTQAMSSLQDVSDYTGQSMNDLTGVMKKYENVIEKSDLATIIKNFSLMNMTAKQTEQMIEALTKSAIRNRNANYTVSEAVRVASEGYRQGISSLSDSAGVTENLSVMQKKYAESIGTTVGKLTEEQVNQAYVNRTMEAAAPFAGAMEEYLDNLAGKQGEYSQALRETQVAYAEAIEPMLIQFEEFKTKMVSGLGDIISEHKSATAGITAFIVTLGTLAIGILAAKKAYDVYTKSVLTAKVAQEGFNAVVKANPVGIAVTGLAVAVSALSAYTAATETQKEAEAELIELQRAHNEVMNGTIKLNSENVSSMKSTRDELKQYIEDVNQLNANQSAAQATAQMKQSGLIDSEEYQEQMKQINAENQILIAEIEKISSKYKGIFKIPEEDIDKLAEVKDYTKKATNSLDKLKQTQLVVGISTKKMSEFLGVYNKKIDQASNKEKIKNVIDTETVKTQQKEAAQLVVNANQMQKYLNIVKNGNKSTTAYKKSVQQLAKAYPEAANGEGIIIEQAQKCIDAEKGKANQAWNTSQTTIKGNIKVISSYLEQARAAKGNVAKQRELANEIGISYERLIPTLTGVLNILKLIGSYKAEEVPNVTPTQISMPKVSTGGSKGSKSSKSYENKKLDNYIKLIEYKKSLDKLTLQQEIKMYQTALNKYAKTTDEKRNLRTKIYELNKELAQKEKDLLDKQTEDYETYIQKQKNLRGSAYDLTEQTKDYDKIIAMHQKYLKKIMKDKRLSLDERKELYREELQIVRDYEQQKRDLMVEQVDNTVSQLTNAITKQLEEAQEREKEAIDKNLEEVEKWKDVRIDAINEEYDARIEAIEKELEALDKAEKQKTRDEEDAEHEKKKKRLEELIAFEHDATTKANYQKELDKLLEEYQKTLDKRALDDKKEALNEQKELLKEEQNNKTQAIEDEAEKQKEIYETQLEELEKYYDEQIDKAQETAEKMLLNVQKNQDKILELLKKYGDAYEITGQSLGEKIAQGIDTGLTNKIKGIIQKVQDTIDANIEAKIKEWTKSNYKYESSANKPKETTINVTQQNYIEQNPEMPSETYRKLNNISEKLAEEIAGM